MFRFLHEQKMKALGRVININSVYDTPGAIESYSFNMALGRCSMTPEVYRQRIREVTVEKMAQMAATLTLHTTFFLKGVEA